MASAMAKLASFLCLWLLVLQVAHVVSARPLRERRQRAEATATSVPAGKSKSSQAAEPVAEPVTTKTECNFTATDSVDATREGVATEEAGEVFATEGIVEGETTPDSQVGQQSYMFDTAMPSHRWYAAMPFLAQAEQDDQDDRDE